MTIFHATKATKDNFGDYKHPMYIKIKHSNPVLLEVLKFAGFLESADTQQTTVQQLRLRESSSTAI